MGITVLVLNSPLLLSLNPYILFSMIWGTILSPLFTSLNIFLYSFVRTKVFSNADKC